MNPIAFAAAHAPAPPLAQSGAFLVLVAVLYITLLGWLRAAGMSPGRVALFRAGLLAWLAVTAAVAMSGVLADFQGMPPRFAFVAGPALLSAVLLPLLPVSGPLLDRGSGFWLVGFQFFRVPMELILWRLALSGVIPTVMTFEGRNYDILVGLTAPVVAWLAFQKGLVSRAPVILWNVFGLALLLNIVTVAILSAPTRFRVFIDGPPNEMIASFPFVWLPAFVVPMALLGHVASIRQLLRAGRAEREADAVASQG